MALQPEADPNTVAGSATSAPLSGKPTPGPESKTQEPPASSLARVAIASLPPLLGAGEHTVQFGIFVCEGQHLVACLQNRLPVHMN